MWASSHLLNIGLGCYNSGDPTTFQEAINSQEKSRWVSAVVEEMESLHKNQMWDLVKLLERKRAIRCKCAFSIKEAVSEKGRKFQGLPNSKGLFIAKRG
jgi:hypothetical protein